MQNINRLAHTLDLENLPEHYHVILLSTIACFLIQATSHSLISPRLFPTHYPQLSPFTKFNWDTRVVAWIHAFYATLIAIHVLRNPALFSSIHQDKLFGYHPTAILVLGNYTSYQLFALSFEDGVSQKAGTRLLNTIRILDLLLSGLNMFLLES
ncbi:hypothetical protein PGTUg99_006932 [Puccinia graminis f. sp. tritici]|uniref:TLC domain-containing protein n=1 Tax=Puccinia graminis f. sp. tritici TaxID=56615 RepID=A0A5B0P208_PUCGR|nr:hypothetical protein PGTUg99_006932 [Puccinia graminis f. sp. tritici]